MSWEYKIIDIAAKQKGLFNSSWKTQEVENYLNELGRNGWELVSFSPPNMTGFGSKAFSAVLKRPK
ncbi:MAG: hypothetical protein Alis3KO_12560 [Aliiglaciecola sp.]